MFLGPGCAVIVATSENRSTLECQLIALNHESAENGGPVAGPFHEMSIITGLIDEFDPVVRLAFETAEVAWKWRVGEAPELPSW